MKTAGSIQTEHPFRRIRQEFAVQPAGRAEVEHPFVGKAGAAGQRPTIVVVPAEEVLLGGSFRIDWVVDDCLGGIHDLLPCPDQPVAELRVVARNCVFGAAYSEIKPKYTVPGKDQSPESGVRPHRRKSDSPTLVAQLKIDNCLLPFQFQPVRLGMAPQRHNSSCDARAIKLVKSLLQARDPLVVQKHIVVSERDDLTLSRCDSRIQGFGYPLGVLENVAYAILCSFGGTLNQRACAVRGVVVYDQ